jgi:hypothetical protein
MARPLLLDDLISFPELIECQEIHSRLALTFIEDNNCWVKPTNKDRVKIGWNGKQALLYRVIFELIHGPIPRGWQVCHSCDNPKCYNPIHLWVGTATDNMEDMYIKVRAGIGKRPKKYNTSWMKTLARMKARADEQTDAECYDNV